MQGSWTNSSCRGEHHLSVHHCSRVPDSSCVLSQAVAKHCLPASPGYSSRHGGGSVHPAPAAASAASHQCLTGCCLTGCCSILHAQACLVALRDPESLGGAFLRGAVRPPPLCLLCSAGGFAGLWNEYPIKAIIPDLTQPLKQVVVCVCVLLVVFQVEGCVWQSGADAGGHLTLPHSTRGAPLDLP